MYAIFIQKNGKTIILCCVITHYEGQKISSFLNYCQKAINYI